MKRIDLAINDMAGILDIPELTEKCNHEECISVFRSFKSYRSGELVIRLKNERAYYAVRDLLTYHDAERTAFDIINRYMRFADREVEKRRSEWKTNEKWAYFIGSDRGRLKLRSNQSLIRLQGR